MFNEEQRDHMRSLAALAREGKVCPCGWFTKEECARRCNSVNGSPEAEAKHRAELAARDAKATT